MLSGGSDKAAGRGVMHRATGGADVLPLGDPDRHFWLARSVARLMQIDFHAAIIHGDLDRETYRGLINRCRTCRRVTACEAWLALSCGRADAPPEGCVIAPDLIALKQLTQRKGAR
jgi:hypothetical protein